MIRKVTTKKKGFTLIELIVVIAILGILAAIAVPRFGGFSDKANISAMNADARTVMSAAQTLLAEDAATLPTDTTIKTLAGALKGNVSWTGTGTALTFTYATTKWTVDVVDGVIGTPTKVTP